MSQALAMWKLIPQILFLLFAALVIYTLLHHPDFAGLAGRVDGALAGVDREAIRSQLRPPLALARKCCRPGLLGAFAAVMLACMISTDESYLHSWGSIFIQDVLLPLRQRPAAVARSSTCAPCGCRSSAWRSSSSASRCCSSRPSTSSCSSRSPAPSSPAAAAR